MGVAPAVIGLGTTSGQSGWSSVEAKDLDVQGKANPSGPVKGTMSNAFANQLTKTSVIKRVKGHDPFDWTTAPTVCLGDSDIEDEGASDLFWTHPSCGCREDSAQHTFLISHKWRSDA